MPQTSDGLTILNATSSCFFETCDGTGQMLLVQDNEPKIQMCDCALKTEIIRNYAKANIPVIYKNLKVDSFDINLYEKQADKAKALKAKKIAIDYVQNLKNYLEANLGLFLFSRKKGSGKTHLAISILIALIKLKKVQGLYCSEYEILDSIKSTFNSNTPTQKVVNSYSHIPLLIVDDFGMEKQTDWVQQTFTKIIDERLSNKRLTIFTSNLTFNEIQGIYKDGRLPSRLESMTIFVAMPEEDLRVKMANKKKDEITKEIFE